MSKEKYDEAYKFVKEHYRPVEDMPGYVWFNMHNMEIISMDTLAKSIVDYWAKWNKEEREQKENEVI